MKKEKLKLDENVCTAHLFDVFLDGEPQVNVSTVNINVVGEKLRGTIDITFLNGDITKTKKYVDVIELNHYNVKGVLINSILFKKNSFSFLCQRFATSEDTVLKATVQYKFKTMCTKAITGE